MDNSSSSPFQPPSESSSESVEQPAATRRWGLGDVALGLGIGFVCSWSFGVAYVLVTHLEEGAGTTLGLTAASLVGIWMGFAGVPIWVSRAKGSGNLVQDFGLRVVLPRDLWRGVLLGLFGQVLVYLVYLPVWLIDPETVKQVSEPAKQVSELGQGWNLLYLVILVGFGAPLAEELFFRGLALRSLVARYGSRVGIGVSAVLFGLTHFELLQLPALVAFGVILGWSAQRNGRLGENLFAHITFNLITLLALAFAG